MSKERKFPTVYQRIVRAAKRGGGMRLSPHDCWQLGVMDEAIIGAADTDDEYQAEHRRERRRATTK